MQTDSSFASNLTSREIVRHYSGLHFVPWTELVGGAAKIVSVVSFL